MRVSLTALLLPCFFLCTANVRADLLIEVQDASIHAAGEGFVDVLITSDSDVLVSGFGLEFEITSGSGNHGTLSFKASPDTSYVTDPDYLLGNTGNLTLTPSGLGLTISDLDTIDHPLLTGVSRLLARLQVVLRRWRPRTHLRFLRCSPTLRCPTKPLPQLPPSVVFRAPSPFLLRSPNRVRG
jgi:hypothetical protein